MSLSEIFKEALLVIKEINSEIKIDSNKLIEIYGLYKQITCGNVHFNNDFKTLKDKRLWESWNSFKNLRKEPAMRKFIEITDVMLFKHQN